jgi:hypothetical protein
MPRQNKLRLDRLTVETFATGAIPIVEGGTVNGYACTAGNSCYCPTAYAQCGTGPATIYSCRRTAFDCA